MLARFVSIATLIALVAILSLAPEPVDAQNAVVVASCPASHATPYTVGTQVLMTVDQNGNLCSQATSAGAGSAVTVADGSDVTQGAQADAACGTDNGTCTVNAVLKRIAQRITTLYTSVVLQAGSAIIGKVGIDQTTPGTTNGVQVNAALPAGTNSIGTVSIGSGYPAGATPITAAATGTTGAATATLAGTGGKTTYICGFVITADATAVAVGTATVTGTITGTLSFIQGAFAATTGASALSVPMFPCVPASATNTGIAVNSIAAGTGGNSAVSAWGYQL